MFIILPALQIFGGTNGLMLSCAFGRMQESENTLGGYCFSSMKFIFLHLLLLDRLDLRTNRLLCL